MICWARYLFLALVAVLALGHMLAACGQKGPLYLPEEDPPERPPAAAPARPVTGPTPNPDQPPVDLPPAR